MKYLLTFIALISLFANSNAQIEINVENNQCVNSFLSISNTTSEIIENYNWDFCEGDFEGDPTFYNDLFSYSSSRSNFHELEIITHQNNWYLFGVSTQNTIYRVVVSDSLNSENLVYSEFFNPSGLLNNSRRIKVVDE